MFAAMQIETGNPITKLILMKLADNANDNGDCWPSLETISRICEVSLRTSKSHIKKLEEMGLISIKKRPLKSGGYSNFYTVNISDNHSASDDNHSASDDNHSASDDNHSASDYTNHGAGDAPKSVSLFNQSIEPLSQSDLEEFIAHRKAIKKTMTDLAIVKFKNLIRRLHDEGYDTKQMIDDAIMNGWQSVVIKPCYRKQSTTSNYDHENDPGSLEGCL